MTATDTIIAVYLVDDQAMIRAGLRAFLDRQEGLSVVGDNGDPRVAVEEIAKMRPDVVLLDITMPGLSGIDAIPKIREAHRHVRILMVTHHEGESFVEQSLKAGADGYLSKDSEPDELALAIRSIYKGRPFVSPKVAGTLVSRAVNPQGHGCGGSSSIETLTPREREVFQLLALGRSNKEVARDLDMSVGTAKKHRENLQRKLGCHSTAEIARLAIREGLLEP